MDSDSQTCYLDRLTKARYIHKSMKTFSHSDSIDDRDIPTISMYIERKGSSLLVMFFFFLQPQHDSFWRSCERLRVFKNRFDETNESTFSTYVQVTKKRMNDEKLNRQQECAYNNDIKCLLIILIYLILQVRKPFKTDEDFQSALKQYDFRWKTQTNNIYNDIYGARSTAIYVVFQQIRLAQSKFSKAKKKRFRYTTRNRKLRQHQKPRGISICAGKQIR